MTETLSDSGAVKLKAGSAVSTSLQAANYTSLINEAENYISNVARKDFVSLYSGLSSSYRLILQDFVSCHAAIAAINYDMSGFTSRQEALIKINILWARMKDCERIILNKVGA
jgi:hypothetical protein